MEEKTIIDCNTLREIFDTHINGDNFILEADPTKATEMPHKAIFYAREEKVFVVVFNEPLKEILENKLKEMGAKQNGYV